MTRYVRTRFEQQPLHANKKNVTGIWDANVAGGLDRINGRLR